MSNYVSLEQIKLGVFMLFPSCVQPIHTLSSEDVYCRRDRSRLVTKEFLLSEAKLS